MTTAPTCSCGDPATEQTHTGTRLTARGPIRHYAWTCEPCTRDWATEQAWSTAQ